VTGDGLVSSGWENGNLVLHVSMPGGFMPGGFMPGGPARAGRLALTPLGVAVTEPQAGLLVPGRGRTDLHEAARSGAAPGLAPVEVTGHRAQIVLDELDRSQRGIDAAYGTATDAVIVVDAGPGARADLLSVFDDAGASGEANADIIDRVNAIVRGIFAADRGFTLTAARCARHGVREPCPLQH
jgi:hypothetical protein